MALAATARPSQTLATPSRRNEKAMWKARKPTTPRSTAIEVAARTIPGANNPAEEAGVAPSSGATPSPRRSTRTTEAMAPAPKTTAASRSTQAGPRNGSLRTSTAGAAAANPAREASTARRLLARTSSSSRPTVALTRAALATPWALDRTSRQKTRGNRARPCTASAAKMASTARPAAAPSAMRRRPLARRSMKGPRKGATTAKGAMVSTSDSATLPLASVGVRLKNKEPARATVTQVSPATDNT